MIVKVPINEVDALRKVCVLSEARCNVFTWTAQYSNVEITEPDGSEIDPESVWHICRSFTYELQMQEAKQK